jgi:hypothetical protein
MLAGGRADGGALFAALDPANYRSIASPKSAQFLLTARSNGRNAAILASKDRAA